MDPAKQLSRPRDLSSNLSRNVDRYKIFSFTDIHALLRNFMMNINTNSASDSVMLIIEKFCF